jgi:hypothetical protein
MNSKHLKISALAAVALLVAGAATTQLSGCADAMSEEELYINYQLRVPASGSDGSRTSQLIDDIDEAKHTIHAALYTLEDEAVADALIRARDRGVDVRVVADADNEDASGFQRLADAQLLPRYGDGELVYLPDFFLSSVLEWCLDKPDEQLVMCTACEFPEDQNKEICSSGELNPEVDDGQGPVIRPGDFNVMSNNYVVIDEELTWNFAFPLDGRDEHPIAWRATGSEFSRDFAREAQQMHGGTFSTTLNAFGGMLKSRQDFNVEYNTSDGPIEVRFNPQERLLKEVIDQVYEARASVYLTTNNLTNPFLLDALEYKRDANFDVQIVINDSGQAAGEARQRLEALGATFVDRELPTLMIVDSASDRNGEEWPRKALVLSHELIRGAPFDVDRVSSDCSVGACGDTVKIFPADQFYDGNMWVITEHGGRIHERKSIDDLLAYWRSAGEE